MKKLTTLMMILAITLLGSDKITELKNTQTEIIVQVDTAYRMGDADSKQSAKKQVLEKAKILASEYAGTYVESNVELVNGKLTKNEVSTLSRAFVSQSITKEQFKMLDNGFMILEATVQSTINKKGMLDKLETISQSKENKNKIAQIQQSNEKLQEELLQVNNELSSLKNSTAALAQKLLAKRETIYKELDANDNVVLTKLNKAEVLSQAVQTKQAYEKDMDDFKCRVNSLLYHLEKIIEPKVVATKVDFDGKFYSLKVDVLLNHFTSLGSSLDFIEERKKLNIHKLNYVGKVYTRENGDLFVPIGKSNNPRILDFTIKLNDKHTITNTILWFHEKEKYSKIGLENQYNSSWREKYERSRNLGLGKEFVFTGLSESDIIDLENISLQVRGNYEYSECVGKSHVRGLVSNNLLKDIDQYMTEKEKEYISYIKKQREEERALKLRPYLIKKQREEERASEISFHLEELIESYINIGLSHDLNGREITRDEHINLSLKVLNDLGRDALSKEKRNLTKNYPLHISIGQLQKMKKIEL
jgi:hypothetical protein